MSGFVPASPESESVPLYEVMAASVDIFEEWQAIERHADDLPPEQRDAYQEGLLRALELLNSRTGVTLDSLPPDLRERLGADPARGRAKPNETDAKVPTGDERVCDECGGELLFTLGAEDGICLSCDT